MNTERSTPEKPHDEHSGSRKKSDEKPSSIVESVSVEQDLMSVDEGPNPTETLVVTLANKPFSYSSLV